MLIFLDKALELFRKATCILQLPFRWELKCWIWKFEKNKTIRNLKKHSVLFLLLVLLTPMVIQSFHAFENHEQEICISKTDQHLHQEDSDCHNFHWNSTTYSHLFWNDEKDLPTQFYTSIFADYSIQLHTVNLSKKSARAPPYFIVSS